MEDNSTILSEGLTVQKEIKASSLVVLTVKENQQYLYIFSL